MSTQKIFMISHKIPASIETKPNEVVLDQTSAENSVVQSAMATLVKEGKQTYWVGALSTGSFNEKITEDDEVAICNQLEEQHMVPVFLDAEQSRLHFRCFSKGFIWPLFHYYGNSSSFSFEEWEAYRDVNDLFAKAAVEKAVASSKGISSKEQINAIKIKTDISPNETLSPRTRYSRKVLGENRSYSFFSVDANETVFVVQDYHLMMAPYYLRKRLPTAKIGFFLHIPWPSSEIYRSLPVRDQVLTGLLASDIIGFQSFAYARHFMSCCTRILGLKVNDKGIQLADGRLVRIEVMPIGIDSEYWMDLVQKPETQDRINELKSSFQGKKIIASRDRIDFIKGVPNKLKAFSSFLKRYPEWQGKVVLLQECRPNPEVLSEKQYLELCEQIAQLVGSINGQFGTIGYTPVHYINRPLKPEESAAMLAVADAGLILPLRDGMNLTAYEFTACQHEKTSPLVLSEFAGAAQCLPGCLLANPWDEKKVTKMILKLLEMSEEEKKSRHKHNLDYISTHTVKYWISNFVNELCNPSSNTIVPKSTDVDILDDNSVKTAYDKTSKRIMFLDYDGTLTPIVKMPHLATPSSETLNLISALSSDPKNKIYVISGRDRKFLEEHLGKLPIGLSGEHGSFLRPCPDTPTDSLSEWQHAFKDLDLSWKDAIFSLFEDFTDRTPGSFIEAKEVNVTWHYRNADPDYGDYQKNQMILALQGIAGKLPIEVINGDKCVEVRPPGINKGAIIRRIMAEQEEVDFVLCLGDDTTDEDMFSELTRHEKEGRTVVTALVKRKPTVAKAYIENQRGVMDLLHTIVGTPDRKHQIRKNYTTL